jgi:hypothetical protein
MEGRENPHADKYKEIANDVLVAYFKALFWRNFGMSRETETE